MSASEGRPARSRARSARLIALALAGAALLASSSAVQGQFRRGGRFRTELRMATPESFDGGFNFCRIVYNGGRFRGGGWSVDYPRADINLSIRLSELTRTPISRDPTGEPNHVLLQLTDDEIFKCPFVMMTEVGGIFLEEDEVARLREYLMKGGFLWADDFWGARAWEVWAEEMEKVMPPGEYPWTDIPLSHPIFHSQFEMQKMPQIPSINFYFGSGGSTSERGSDSAEVHARGIVDKNGNLMVLATHNTDLGDAFEREGDNKEYFYKFSVDGYAMGINILLYTMTH